jgi:hypothetical protein
MRAHARAINLGTGLQSNHACKRETSAYLVEAIKPPRADACLSGCDDVTTCVFSTQETQCTWDTGVRGGTRSSCRKSSAKQRSAAHVPASLDLPTRSVTCPAVACVCSPVAGVCLGPARDISGAVQHLSGGHGSGMLAAPHMQLG